ncbi:MAG: protein kinase, partial [Candidatus Eremiobacterota bacterium]
MPVKLIPCGNFANESEHYACEFIEARLKSVTNTDQWYILTNLSLSSGFSYQLPPEIDMVAIGTKGIYVIEIKHWNKVYINDSHNIETIKNEAVKINHKAKMIAGKLRKNNYSSVGFINGLFLLTGNEKEKFKEINGKRKQIEGIEVFSLSEWKEIFLINNELNIQKEDLEKICNILAPSSNIILSRTIRNFQNFTNLELIGDRSGLFHRVFKGLRKPGREKIILNLYDFSAIREKNPYLIAEREFNVFQKLQKSSYLPPVMDSFQEAVNYPGELYFFTYIDPQSPSLFERSEDITWTVEDRILTAKLCFDALKDFHNNFDETVLHRNITPETIRVRSNNEPIFTRFQFARIVGSVTITGFIAPEFKGIEDFVAPEVLSSGLGACTEESDIYSLCKTLYVIFKDKGDFSSVKEVLHILSCGTNSDPFKRASLQEIRENFDLFYKPSLSLSAGRIDVKYWDEDTVKELNGRYYKIINKLGSGNVGCTFKVKEIDGKTGEEISGPYVAKVITNKDIAEQAMEAYAKVRAQTGGNYLAGVLEVRREWKNNEITALLKWIEGEPLSEIKGVLPLYLDELKEGKREEILLEWIKKLCEGLSELHRENFIHGDVTPRNIIINKNNVTLTDFDLSIKSGSVPAGGSSPYCSPDVSLRLPAGLSDDIYALSASIFEVLFERSAFNYRGITKKDRGINWEGIDKTEYLRLAEFMDKANNPDKNKRYTSAMEVVEKLTFNPDISINKSKEHYGEILKNIYPFIEIADEILADVVFEEKKLHLWQAVELLQQNPDRWHAVITGEGGAGKTTSLLKLYERFLSSPSLCPIPVFISLSRYNHLYNILTEDRRKDIIWHIIIEEYLNYVPSDKEIRFIKNFFRNKEKTQINNKKLPSYVFLLDGFDEITVDTLGLLFNLNEIKDFMKSVEIIISSRYDLNNIPGWQGLNSLFITPLEDEQIEVFMSSKEIIFRKDLLDEIPLLRNPMMLTLYCNTEKYIKEYYSKEDYDFIYVPRYKAEIIHNFIEYYILRHDKNSPQKKALHRFYLRHLLPRIAYEMESNGLFELSRSILKNIIQEEFILYSSEEFLETYPYLDELISDEILSSLDSSKRQNISEAIRKLKQKYYLLKDTGKSSFYSFLHSEFRDYFSAVYIKEKLQAGIKSGDNTFPELYSRIFPSYLRNMIGELMEEPKRRPVIEKGYKKGEIKETILDRALDLLKSKNLKNMSNDDIGLFIDSLILRNTKEKKQDYRVLNIIEILKAKRVDLSDTDLSYLDLSKSLLNNVMLGHGKIDGKLYGANLTGSRFNGDNIFPQGHAESVIRVSYSTDGNRIISESFDGITKEWDIKTGKCLETYEKVSTISSQRIYSCDHAFGV